MQTRKMPAMRTRIYTREVHKVDGKTIKEDTFYTLKNGKFVIAE